MNRFFPIWGLIGLAWLSLAGTAQAVTCLNNLPASNPDAVYIDHGDGTVTDSRTGLMWKQCIEGLGGANCASGSSKSYTWSGALAQAEASTFAGYDDWRLPNIKELRSLVEECRISPAINDTLFPNTPNSSFWSGSPYAGYSTPAWSVSFGDGYAGYFFRSSSYRVRLVRGGQSFETFDLTVTKTGTGGGTVTSAPAGISCSATCKADFTVGTPITLTAKPATGSTFGGWTGCTRNPTNPRQCTLTLSADTTVKATFRSTAPKSDFVITGIALTPLSPAANGLFSAKVTVKNQGTLAGDGGYLDLWTNSSTVPTCGAEGNAWATVGTLAIGASKTLTFTNLRAGRAGAKTLRAFVDSWCENSESNETNNKRAKVYTVK